MRFWDASAVLPLLVRDEHHAAAVKLYADDPAMTTWCLTPVEVWSGIARRRRDGIFRSPDVRDARARLAALERSWIEVLSVDAVRPIARRLLETHPLRTADALQLAAALYATDERPEGVEFATFDRRLASAADGEGFDVVGVTSDGA
jgi:predicted nucleic acid-binding protein